MQRITEFEDGFFVPSFAEVRRFRCPSCGSTDSMETPETEPGFRMSEAAADRIVEASIELGMKVAGKLAHIDAATVSRLVAARADRLMETKTRPRVAGLDTLESGVVAVSDAWTGDSVACFSSSDDPRLLPWLSRPYPAVVIPSPGLASQAIRWSGMKVVVAKDTAIAMIKPLMQKARQRFEAAARSLHGGASDPAARHFLRSSERLYAAVEADDLDAGRFAVTKWVRECSGFWAEVFAPVLRFISTYGDYLFNHALYLQPRPPIRLEFTGPANLLTLALEQRHHVAPPRIEGPRPRCLVY